MKFKIQLITQHETDEVIQELTCLDREAEGLEEVGITLAEAKALFATLQRQGERTIPWAGVPMLPPVGPLVLPRSIRGTSDRRFSAARGSGPVRGSAAADVRRAGSSASAVSSQRAC